VKYGIVIASFHTASVFINQKNIAANMSKHQKADLGIRLMLCDIRPVQNVNSHLVSTCKLLIYNK